MSSPIDIFRGFCRSEEVTDGEVGTILTVLRIPGLVEQILRNPEVVGLDCEEMRKAFEGRGIGSRIDSESIQDGYFGEAIDSNLLLSGEQVVVMELMNVAMHINDDISALCKIWAREVEDRVVDSVVDVVQKHFPSCAPIFEAPYFSRMDKVSRLLAVRSILDQMFLYGVNFICPDTMSKYIGSGQVFTLPGFEFGGDPEFYAHEEVLYDVAVVQELGLVTVPTNDVGYALVVKACHANELKGLGVKRAFTLSESLAKKIFKTSGVFIAKNRKLYFGDLQKEWGDGEGPFDLVPFSVIPAGLKPLYAALKTCPGRTFYLHPINWARTEKSLYGNKNGKVKLPELAAGQGGNGCVRVEATQDMLNHKTDWLANSIIVEINERASASALVVRNGWSSDVLTATTAVKGTGNSTINKVMRAIVAKVGFMSTVDFAAALRNEVTSRLTSQQRIDYKFVMQVSLCSFAGMVSMVVYNPAMDAISVN